MSTRSSLKFPAKSARRTRLIDEIVKGLRSDETIKLLDIRHKSEGSIKQSMYHVLKNRLIKVHKQLSPGLKESTCERKANESLVWEGDVKNVINNILFLGAQHRPDFVVLIDGLRIAVEVKRGESGSSIREGVGQSIVYAVSGEFEFVIYLFVDTSKDKKIVRSTKQSREKHFIASLWEQYNVRFAVV